MARKVNNSMLEQLEIHTALSGRHREIGIRKVGNMASSHNKTVCTNITEDRVVVKGQKSCKV